MFKKRPLMNSLKDTGYLLKNSFTIIGKEEDIKTPTIHMAVLSAIITTVIFGSILTFFLPGAMGLLGVLGLAIAIIILKPFKAFYNMRQRADQSWIVYNTLSGRDITYKAAHKHTKQSKGTLRWMAIIQIIVDYAKSQSGDNQGILGVIIQLLMKALEEVWDLLSHYMIPAVAIENKHFKEVVPELKSLRNNVPATLTGVFGLDFAGDVVRRMLFPVYLVFLAISVGVGYLVAMFTEATVITVSDFSFSWVPVIAMLYIVFVIGGIIKVLVESIKTIYFTIFYTSIVRPMDIQESMRDQITNYLLMKRSDFDAKNTQTQPNEQQTQQHTHPQQNTSQNPQSNPSQETKQNKLQIQENPQTQQSPSQQAQPQAGQQPSQYQQYIAKLANYIHSYLQQGHSGEEITQFLLQKGYPHKEIDEAVDYMHKHMQ